MIIYESLVRSQSIVPFNSILIYGLHISPFYSQSAFNPLSVVCSLQFTFILTGGFLMPCKWGGVVGG